MSILTTYIEAVLASPVLLTVILITLIMGGGMVMVGRMIMRLFTLNHEMANKLAEQEQWLHSASQAPETLINQLKDQLREQAGTLTQAAVLVANDVNEACEHLERSGQRLEVQARESRNLGTNINDDIRELITRMDTVNQGMMDNHSTLEERVISHSEKMAAENTRLDELVKEFERLAEKVENQTGSVNHEITQAKEAYAQIGSQLDQNGQEFIAAVQQSITKHQEAAEELNAMKQAVETEAEAAANQIASQRQDLAAVSDQARRGAEEIGALLDDKLKQVSDSGQALDQKISNTLAKVQTLQSNLEQQISKMEQQGDAIEQQLFTHSENAIAKLKQHVDGFIGSVDPVLNKSEQFATKLDRQTQYLESVEKQAGMQVELIDKLTGNNAVWLDNLDRQLTQFIKLHHDMEAARTAMSDMFEESDKTLRHSGEGATERAVKIGETLSKHGQALVDLIEEVTVKLNGSGNDYGKQIGALNAAAQEAKLVLETYSKQLDDQSERLTTSSVAAGMQFSDHQTMLENLSVRLGVVASDSAEQFDQAVTKFSDGEKKLLSTQNDVATSWQKLSERLKLQLDEIKDINQHAELQLNNVFEGLSGQREWLERTIELADGGLGQLLEGMREETSELATVVENINQQVALSVQSIQGEVSRLTDVGKTSLEQASKIRDDYEVEARDLFKRTSRHIIEDLNSISIDLTRALDGEVSEADWRRYIKGDRTIFSRSLLRNRQDAIIRKIAERVRSDAEMRGYVSRYVELFDQLLHSAESSDSENLLHATFLTSDVGKLYVILGKALGKQD